MSEDLSIYTIPAGVPFAKTLAESLLRQAQESGQALSHTKILLPTRRACRVLQDSFLQISGGKPLLLPALQPVGDIDEQELSFALAGTEKGAAFRDLPPSISPLRRRILLARTIAANPSFHKGFDQAMILAEALGRFIDQIHTEGLDIKDLHNLVPEEFAQHWQITLDFLEIIGQFWPIILENEGAIDPAQRRDRLLHALSDFWEENPPQTPVIAAGTTGSIPSVARLLGIIARLPRGAVILPGLDQSMDQKSWDALDETHAQYGLKHLLERLDVQRTHVRIWPSECMNQQADSRILLSEIMRPAETTGAWKSLGEQPEILAAIKKAVKNLTLHECDTPQKEAALIALHLREVLEKTGKKAAVITPDRALARRIAAALSRWGITVDDSAGTKLSENPVGIFLSLLGSAVEKHLAPAALLALLKHPFCGLSGPGFALEALEKAALRGLKPAPGFEGIFARLGKENTEAAALLEWLRPKLEAFLGYAEGLHPFKTLLQSHLKTAEALCDPGILWKGEAGEAAASCLAELQDHSPSVPDMSLAQYLSTLHQIMSTITVRPAYGTHPRLSILGQLEARLIDADLIVLAGLNEGIWPPDPGHDPWLSRPMRAAFGLPSPERQIGLAAHDFAQGFCAPRVIMTRSCRTDGAPSVPARWLQRLETVLKAAGLEKSVLYEPQYDFWAQQRDHVQDVRPIARPAPTPPAQARPKRLSVTRIETWMRDPYSIYGEFILGLKKLDPLEKPPGPAECGTLLHDILERFVKAWPQNLPDDPMEILLAVAREELARHHDDPALWSFWWARFHRICDWLIEHERSWRDQAQFLAGEIKGEIQVPGTDFTLSCKADRIDRLADGSAAITDYKTGGALSGRGIETGAQPQLSLEAAILLHHGFTDLEAEKIGYLSYWKLTGGSEPGQEIAKSGDLNPLAEKSLRGLQKLIAAFSDPHTPYYALPRPTLLPRFNDYEHLARVKEWVALDDDEITAQEAA